MTGNILSPLAPSNLDQNYPNLISASVYQIPVTVVPVILISSRKKINLLFVDWNIFKAQPSICIAVMTY